MKLLIYFLCKKAFLIPFHIKRDPNIPYIKRLIFSFRKSKHSGGLMAQYSKRIPIASIMIVPKSIADFPVMTTFFCQSFSIAISP